MSMHMNIHDVAPLLGNNSSDAINGSYLVVLREDATEEEGKTNRNNVFNKAWVHHVPKALCMRSMLASHNCASAVT